MTIHRITGTAPNTSDFGLDEIVASNIDFHIERMSDSHFWFSVTDGARIVNVHLVATGKRLVATVEE